jgi:hypothetical protein
VVVAVPGLVLVRRESADENLLPGEIYIVYSRLAPEIVFGLGKREMTLRSALGGGVEVYLHNQISSLCIQSWGLVWAG